MRATGFAVLLTLLSVCSVASELGPAIYHSDPSHLWNRLYNQMAVRTFAGVRYGVDLSEPYPDEFDDPQRLIQTLDEFLSPTSQQNLPEGMSRALLLNDVWTAFDVASALSSRSPRLELRLARALESLRMTSDEISGLEDNYKAAVKSGRYARDFDPAHPEIAFLPPDLFDPRGPWVQVGGGGRGLVAPLHTQLVSGRSTFMVFMRCPGGREETLSYLSRLNLHKTPWQLNQNPLGTGYPNHQKVRTSVLRPDPNTPQFPHGTIVALVRQMFVIDEQLAPVPTPITQKLQFRVYANGSNRERASDRQSQHVYTFVMRRKDVVAHVGGGLHALTAGHREYQGLLVPAQRNNAAYFGGYVILDTCASCHSGDGILSVRSYLGVFDTFPANPQLLPTNTSDEQSTATIQWKKLQFNWGLLQGILEAQRANP